MELGSVFVLYSVSEPVAVLAAPDFKARVQNFVGGDKLIFLSQMKS